MHGANTGTSRSLPQKHFTSGTETTVPGRTRWTDELESGALEERNSRLSASEPTGRAVDTHHPPLPHKQARGPCGHVFPVHRSHGGRGGCCWQYRLGFFFLLSLIRVPPVN